VLWRTPYKPRVLERSSVPGLPDGICLGIFDARAQSELGIWLRLFESAGIDRSTHIVAVGLKDRRKVETVLPPSRHGQLLLLADEEKTISNLINPDRPERSFAAIVRHGFAPLLVVGAPTEEVWERFEAEARIADSLA